MTVTASKYRNCKAKVIYPYQQPLFINMGSDIYLKERGNSVWLKHLMMGTNSPNNDTWSEMSWFLYSRAEIPGKEPAI